MFSLLWLKRNITIYTWKEEGKECTTPWWQSTAFAIVRFCFMGTVRFIFFPQRIKDVLRCSCESYRKLSGCLISWVSHSWSQPSIYQYILTKQGFCTKHPQKHEREGWGGEKGDNWAATNSVYQYLKAWAIQLERVSSIPSPNHSSTGIHRTLDKILWNSTCIQNWLWSPSRWSNGKYSTLLHVTIF